MIRSRATTLDRRGRALASWLDPLSARVREPEVAWLAGQPDVVLDPPVRLAEGLVAAVRACLVERGRVEDRAEGLRAFCQGTVGLLREQVLARHVRATVEDPWERWLDLRALKRDLDLDALLEREAESIEREGTRIEVAVRILGRLAADRLSIPEFEHTGAHELLRELVAAETRLPTRRAAVAALAEALTARLRTGPVDPRGLQALQALARARGEDPWSRRAALPVVRGLEPTIAARWLADALAELDGRESWLLRARAVELALEPEAPDDPLRSAFVTTRPGWQLDLIERHLEDPAELVRFEVVQGLARRWSLGDARAGELLVRAMGAASPRTRARAVASAGRDGLPWLGPRLLDVPLVAGFALDEALAAARDREPLPDDVVAALQRLVAEGSPALARRASLVLSTDRTARGPLATVAAGLGELRPGEERTVALPEGCTAEQLAEALLPAAAEGHGFWLSPALARRVTVRRGDTLRPKLWRFLHELRHPGPSKRQTLSHALGRADLGPVRVPPARLAEESATGVPGERVRLEREDGWVPGLPLVDDYLHALSRGRVTVVAAEGTASVEAPRNPLRRLWARVTTTWSYARLDALRTASVAEADPALRSRYVAAFAKLGFRTRSTTPSTGPWSAYFAASLADPVAYLLSMRSNTLTHLSLVVAALAAVLLARVSVVRAALRQSRASVPLVLGGWGTRGKSGTERLKAGLFEGLGVPLLSKTTGCEAMVLHAPPGGHAMELFLFRPYDRATIWEQVDVVRMAPKLGARTLLWECMALNPLYVDLLQTRWMSDDLSTLTNAYPDHEDIMGPSGMDVARAIGGFSPRDATVFTTEENMRAELAEVALQRNARLVPVSRAERELVPTELLDRMPHVEHPSNVALAASVGRAFGLPVVEAIGLMGEHVVPDLGALSISPPARHLSREISFANGMSANDTLSFRHNWRRAGFADHDPTAEPGTFLVTVINNRADRVARSRVFAQVAVEDAAAHRHVLIGTNVRGFMNYVDEAIARKVAAASLETPEKVDALFAHLRLVDPADLASACAARLGASTEAQQDFRRAWEALGPAPVTLSGARRHVEALRGAAATLERACTGAGGLAEAVLDAAARWAATRSARTASVGEVRALYGELTRAAFVVVDDPGSTGDQTITRVLQACPPGARVRLMGIQNIKGTGLDFAYQWVWWRELHKGLVELASEDPARQRRGLAVVEGNPFGSGLACDEALAVLRALRPEPSLQTRVKLQLARIEARLAELLVARTRTAKKTGMLGRLTGLVERFLDPFDAVWRRRRARQVFRDLTNRRISHPRAQAWLQALTARQKGKWIGRGRKLQ